MKHTKIICTIGPKSQDQDTIVKMAKAGMNVVRMNLSHGTYNFHAETINITRKVSVALGMHIGVLFDLQGPKIRIGKLKKETMILNKGERITLTVEEKMGDWQELSVNYSKLPQEAELGERIFLDDGNIELKVIGVGEKSIECKIVNGGVIRPYRGINLPDTSIGAPSLTEKDLRDLEFGLEEGVDYIALSFVRTPEDINDLRNRITRKEQHIPIIAKIEKPEAVKNLDEIIQVTDGVMIARGDLGAETSPQDVPILQKLIIEKCNLLGKPVVTATQMLESMINRPRPTRAEASDVANAIFDGTDAVMLSGETAVGEYPVTAVKVMARIAEKTEYEINKVQSMFRKRSNCLQKDSVADSVCFSACRMTDQLKPKYIVSFTISGRTATLMSKHRPSVPIIAMSPSDTVLRRLSIYRGIRGININMVDNTEELINSAEKILLDRGLCREEDMVIMVGGVPVLAGEPTNMLKVHKVKLGDKNI